MLTPKIFPLVMPSWVGSLASRFLSLATGLPRTTSGGCGPSSSESFAVFDPESSSWRTSQGSLLPEWETYSVTWPRAGMTRSGRAYLLPRLVPPISAGDSSLWPTPRASGVAASASMEVVHNIAEPRGNLEEVVAKHVGPSPDRFLNPQFVEWLMGFPQGWTDLKDSGTPSSPK